MLLHNLRISIRHHSRNKLYTGINIAGLAIGITCVLLAILYSRDERSFDAFHANNPHLYRITTSVVQPKDGSRQTLGGTGQVQGPAFKAAVPEIADYVRVMGGDIYGDLIANDKVLKQQLLFVDERFFNVFSFPLLKGDSRTVLQDAGSAVITESTALKYFSRTDVVGQLLRMDADPSARKLGKPLVITGVVKDPPKHSSIQFDILLPFRFLQLSFEDTDWLNQYLSTFIVLRPDATVAAVTAKINKVYATHAGEQLAAYAQNNGFKPQISFGLQQMTAIHLDPMYQEMDSREGGIVNGSNPVFSYIFLGIAVFILLMAAINFINISLASSLKRTREVGVRKINGSSGVQIMSQLLTESAVLCSLALILAMILTWLSLPVFNTLAGKEILFTDTLDPILLGYCGGVLATIVILTGTYPAYVLSNFHAVQALSNKQKLFGRNILGRVLVVVQFSLAIFLLLFTLLFYQQMDYVRTKDLGYDPHQVVRTQINGDQNLQHVQEVLKAELAKEPGIQVVAFGGERRGASPVKLSNKTLEAVHRVIDENYLSVMGIALKEGRNFSTAYTSDKTNGVIVNEAFVKAAGLTHPIGTSLQTDEYFDKTPKTIIGVIKDFHAASLRERIQPMVLIMNDWFGSTVWLKVTAARQPQALGALEAAFHKALPQTAFSYGFLDEINSSEYAQELRWKQIIRIATLLSIVICCMGLLGLAHIATRQRRKEIGIRTILGASVANMVALFSRDFLRLVLLAFVMTSPVAWYVMNSWLQQFAYRTAISQWLFIAAGSGALLIAFVTVSVQVVGVIWAHPIKSLRSE
jgi:putative ABC transport system permease protein